jgi:hypothetical protein
MRAVRVSWPTRAGSAAAVAVLAVGGVLASAAGASAAAGHGHAKLPTTLRISNKLVAHHHHHADAVSGVLDSRRKPVAGETVTLKGRAGKHRKWVVVGSSTTDSKGTVTFTIGLPTKTAQAELVFAGDSTYRKSHSNVITLKK